ncbi:cytochrome-c oxidase, cbb3-type subunit III [Undibacterium cyanobacteriorum]|uniref:Cbb3-type cytochrome c oxidase subunit n=1 Tax=Undibacterium cyanobacteriorum TaxID=3073561 RepID=A0ABY9RM48_9BURK|nr:cytochrome-c oxidase, cbb3-type subunit III [Undibacterium sp. 20NA77.5]WMW82274.1 cytochrome-c oxidase, cbb3-type subunit III [Undibacterium sp. 20NA77.5]
MADFISEWWGTAIAIVTAISILACGILLWAQSKVKVKIGSDGKPLPAETTGHVWDENLSEQNNPLPKWWMWLFYLTLIYSVGYLVVYPGFGAYQGKFGWSQTGAYDKEMKDGEAQYGPLFNKYLGMDVAAVAKDPQAHEIGQRLFLNTCAQCHGSDAQGGKGYPNLTDSDWLYGGDPQVIKTTITEGRHGQMPPMGAALGGEDDVRNVANYVMSLSGAAHDPIKAALGKSKFGVCAACHGADGKGNQALGSPNLTDKVWLYGGGIDTIMETINKGRSNQMPAHKALLSEAKIHLLTAYVWSLSNSGNSAAAASEANALKQIEAADASAASK